LDQCIQTKRSHDAATVNRWTIEVFISSSREACVLEFRNLYLGQLGMKVVHSFLIALILASSGCGQTPAPQPDRVDDFVQGEMQRQHIPGLSLLVARDGKVLLAKGYGFANVELQVPVKPETVFQSVDGCAGDLETSHDTRIA